MRETHVSASGRIGTTHVSSEDGTDEINTKECSQGKSEGKPTGRRVPTGILQGGVAEERECGGGAGEDLLESGIHTERNTMLDSVHVRWDPPSLRILCRQ